ncbi:o-succinylbenzoate-CoA ligase [Campylobacter blaseri]|uniref:Acyl-CoA synthetase n=1 Tax=Campylobacter blaseri TaxID=2042961 RepID=A0A2P8QZJ8_9BACT|nr:AMP-binding protein [Campylobacter blaseri]PSM51674.1 acyl-CoA synthetase [Campylobacter blaseri]PSM53464.1 acyl-CoA synthetase [Campylobacter blaseri]QKF86269.1 o-succinylbenzoate-CoA ligase [Campylobacter blaseri]
MQIFPKEIILNGKNYEIDKLLNNEFLDEIQNEVLEFLKNWYDEKDYLVVHTSGSTGTPKEIKLEKSFIAKSAKRTLKFFNLQKFDKVLLCLSLDYIAGKLMVVRALIGGLNLCVAKPNSDFAFLKYEKESFKFVAMVPNQVYKLLDTPSNFSKIDTLLLGGQALSSSLKDELLKVKTKCYIGYGMTETATHIALKRVNLKDANENYKVLEGIKIWLENGCLAIKMPGLEKPLITNDLANIINENEFEILGRADNIIISGGLKFIPEVIEKKLESYIDKPFFISSKIDEKLGHKIVLVIETKKDESYKKQIQKVFEEHLSRYERPKEIYFKDEFKRTKTGKIIRKL